MIAFDIYGKFAHFRKFYTNSSSLTYSVPPRTTIEGMIAALLGYERDSYYELLGADKLNIAVKKIGATRKIMQSLNYMKADSPGKLNSPTEHTQIPFEILTGDRNLRYRIFLYHIDDAIQDEIKKRTKNNRPVFPLYFGCAPFSCYIEYIDEYEWEWAISSEYKNITTVIDTSRISKINIESMDGSLIKERMTRDFSVGRTIKEVCSYIYEQEGRSLNVIIEGGFCRLSNGENIMFL
ncbi:type I-B CRISPR-associated protein Cas5 [Clostridium sp. Cult2]|nr:type I-B CRISPR-associated protein Cas5 [Clostridium sp. Cult2]